LIGAQARNLRENLSRKSTFKENPLNSSSQSQIQKEEEKNQLVENLKNLIKKSDCNLPVVQVYYDFVLKIHKC
jgi:hypothetical protein